METYDLAVIGSGPGGYVAAIRAAQLKLKVVCIEMSPTLGGTCLNVGCIPSKALLESTGAYFFIKQHGERMGVMAPSIAPDFSIMMNRKNSIVKTITEGVKGLFKKNGVTSIFGKATLTGPNTIDIDGKQTIEAKNIILATGSAPITLPFLPIDEKKILTSTGALALDKVPEKLIVIGAGVIGVELGSVYARLGSDVTFIEALDGICGALDPDVHRVLLASLKKQGLKFHLGTPVKSAKIEDKITITAGDMTLDGDAVLVGIGRKPYTDGLGLEKAGVQATPRGQIIVDEFFRTSVPHIYAVGDIIDGPMLAHKASEEGTVAAEIIAGENTSVDYMTIPSIIYTHPEVATLGFTEPEAREKGLETFSGICPLMANARARCMDDNEGMVKVIGDKKSGKLIGLHIVAPHASELIGEGVVAIKKRMTVEELANTCHGHPTLSEAIKEACLVALSRPINL